MHCIYRDNTLNATREGVPITLAPLMRKSTSSVFYNTLQAGESLAVLIPLKSHPSAECERARCLVHPLLEIWEHQAIAIHCKRGEKRSQTALGSASVRQFTVRTLQQFCKQTPDLYGAGAAPGKSKGPNGYL